MRQTYLKEHKKAQYSIMLFFVFPILKEQLENNYGVNIETLKMIMNYMLIFYPFLNAVFVVVVSRGIFEEVGNELLYFYQNLSSHIFTAFTVTILLYLSSFFILAHNYGFLYVEYIKIIFLSCFLSGISALLLTLTKTAVCFSSRNFSFLIAGLILAAV